MPLAAEGQLTDQDVRSTASVQGGAALGELRKTADGRRFRYGVNGTGSGTALAAGKLNQVATASANHVNRTGVTTVVGQQSVTFAVGNTLVSSNQYAQGYLVVNAGTGAGQALLISGNNAVAANGSPVVNLADAIMTATSVSDSKFSLHPHPYGAVIVNASTLGAGAAGVNIVSVADTYFAWFQVGGVCSVLSDAGAAAIGAPITYSDDTAGAVGPAETDAVGATLGYALILGVSAEYRPVYLTIS
jgi:hypothetical protein